MSKTRQSGKRFAPNAPDNTPIAIDANDPMLFMVATCAAEWTQYEEMREEHQGEAEEIACEEQRERVRFVRAIADFARHRLGMR